MKKMKTLTMLGLVAIAVSAISITAFAASIYDTPAQAVAGLTGRTEESVIDERAETGSTYGTIADEAGKLEEFKDAMLEIKKDRLAESVESGRLTQEQADEVLARIEANLENCDGTGSQRIGQAAGAGFGGGNGQGQGNGQGMMGGGRGQCNGTCTAQ